MKNNKINWWLVIGVALVVSVVASLITLNLTGDVIKVDNLKKGKYSIYTKEEVDKKLGELKGTCQYIHYKDSIYTRYNLDNISIMNVCQKILGGFVPKIIVETESEDLYTNKIAPQVITFIVKLRII